jgi:hypothetical protein
MDEQSPPQAPGTSASPAPQPTSGPPPGYGPTGAGPGVPPGDWFTRLLQPAFESKGWLRFLGVVAIASGALAALTIVGILFAWLYVWVGVLLWQAGERAGQAWLQRDPAVFEQFMRKLKTLITIAGVATVLSLAVGLLAFLTALSLGWMALLATQLGL